jgi:hypothetical protein
MSVIDWTAGVVIQKRKIFAEPQKLLKFLSLVIRYLGKWANRPSPILVRSYLAKTGIFTKNQKVAYKIS